MKITFTGEIVCNFKIYNCFNNNYNGLFDNIRKYISESDYVIGNLETTLTTNKLNVSQKPYYFCVHEDYLKYLKDIGWNLLYTANNHCLDCGFSGLIETINILDKYGIYHTGTFKKRNNPLILQNSIGIINYTYGTNSEYNNVYLSDVYNNINIIDIQHRERKYTQKLNNKLILNDINYLKDKKCQLIIFELHAGNEYSIKQSSDVEKMCFELCSYGCDIVICNHAHVVHEHKSIGNKNIFYCLGNVNHYRGVIDDILQRCSYPCINYSILLHYDTVSRKFTFNIIKTILENNKPSVKNIYDIPYINIYECKYIYEKFTKGKFPGIQEVYLL